MIYFYYYCDMSQSNLQCASFTCTLQHIHKCDMLYLHILHVVLTSEMWLISTCVTCMRVLTHISMNETWCTYRVAKTHRMFRFIFRNRATNYRDLLRKMTYEDKASYDSTPSYFNKSCHAYERVLHCIIMRNLTHYYVTFILVCHIFEMWLTTMSHS